MQAIVGTFYKTQAKALEKLKPGETIIEYNTGWIIVKNEILKLIK